MVDLNDSAQEIQIIEAADVVASCTEEPTSKVMLDDDLNNFELVEQSSYITDIAEEKSTTITQIEKEEQIEEVAKTTSAQIKKEQESEEFKMDLEKKNMAAIELNQAVEIERLKKDLLLRDQEILLLKQAVEIEQLTKELVLRDQELLSLKQVSECIEIKRKDVECNEVKMALMENTLCPEKQWSMFSCDLSDADHVKTIKLLKIEIASLNTRLKYLERQNSYKNNSINFPITRNDYAQTAQKQDPAGLFATIPYTSSTPPSLPAPDINTNNEVFAIPRSIFNTSTSKTTSVTCSTFYTAPKTTLAAPTGLTPLMTAPTTGINFETVATPISSTCGMFETAPSTAPVPRFVSETAVKILPSSGSVTETAPITKPSNRSIFQTAPTTVSGICSIFKTAATTVSGAHISENAPSTVSGAHCIFETASKTASNTRSIFNRAPTLMAIPTGGGLFNSVPKNTLATSGIFDTALITASATGSIFSAASTTALATSTCYGQTSSTKTASASGSVTSVAAQNSRELLTTSSGETDAMDFEFNKYETSVKPCTKDKHLKLVQNVLVSLQTRVADLEKRQADLIPCVLVDNNGAFINEKVTNRPLPCTPRNTFAHGIFGPKNYASNIFLPQNPKNTGTVFTSMKSNINGIGGFQEKQPNTFATQSRIGCGTHTVKFFPVRIWDWAKNHSEMITCALQCITIMPGYENMSMEELRLEDYNLRKPAVKWWEQLKRTGRPAASTPPSQYPLLFG